MENGQWNDGEPKVIPLQIPNVYKSKYDQTLSKCPYRDFTTDVKSAFKKQVKFLHSNVVQKVTSNISESTEEKKDYKMPCKKSPDKYENKGKQSEKNEQSKKK